MAHNIDTVYVDDVTSTQVKVFSVELEAERGDVRVTIEAVRVGPNVYVSVPNALDVPEDFRNALQEWLDTGNEV